MPKKVEAYADGRGELFSSYKEALGSDIDELLDSSDYDERVSACLIRNRKELINMLLAYDNIAEYKWKLDDVVDGDDFDIDDDFNITKDNSNT